MSLRWPAPLLVALVVVCSADGCTVSKQGFDDTDIEMPRGGSSSVGGAAGAGLPDAGNGGNPQADGGLGGEGGVSGSAGGGGPGGMTGGAGGAAAGGSGGAGAAGGGGAAGGSGGAAAGSSGSGGGAAGAAGGGAGGTLSDNGRPCDDNSACASGHCVEGVCCESACSSGCTSCKLSGDRGRCRPLSAGEPPRFEGACVAQDSSTCGRTGKCDGAGACATYAEGTICRAAGCMADSLAAEHRCQQGRCEAGAVTPCSGGLRCRDFSCPNACASSSDCVEGLTCLAEACVPDGTATIPYTSMPPQIDGEGDDAWGGIMGAQVISKLTFGMVSAGDPDLSGGWKMLWDEQALYVIVLVRDSLLRSDSTFPWEDDAVEIFVDGDYSRGSSYDGNNDLQYVFGWKPDNVPSITEVALKRTQGVVAAQRTTSDGYIMEVRIPWATLGVEPMARKRLGIDVHIDDDDDGGNREGQKAWFASTNIAWRRPDAFGHAVLLGP